MPFKSLNQVLKSLEQQYTSPEQQRLLKIRSRWVEIVGPVVAAQTRPLGIQKGVLRVATASAAWAQNLVFERQRILAKLNGALALQLLDIRFSTAQWQEGSRSASFPGAEEQAALWGNHPSRLTAPTHLPIAPADSEPVDPLQVFQTWKTTMRSQMQSLPLCPQCHCPTPPGELDRWQVCGLCAAKQWHGK